MNLEIFNVATQGVASVGAFLVREDLDSLNKNTISLVSLSDDELRARCREAIRGEDTQQVQQDGGFFTSITSYLGWFDRRVSALTIKRIALATESFKRAPADLPPGSALYPQQIQAAVSLTRRCLIQMDTGEGKTYALLPAAFALACAYHRVYIVCANDYLAWRDAHRTRSYWEFVGLQHSLCLTDSDDDEWSSRIIYTTLRALMVKHMRNQAKPIQPAAPITFGAILIDEADAILLDQGDKAFTLVETIKADSFDWSFALQYAETLGAEDVEVDYGKLDANLTITGETRLRETLGDNASQESTYLLNRLAVELAHVAVKVAVEDRDYIIEDGRIHAVDTITGKVLRNASPPHWVIPLEIRKGFEPRAETIPSDEITTLTLLTKFQHWSGLSGTLVDDALEYLFLYFLPTLVIEPRRKRQRGLLPDLIFRTKPEANDALCQEVLEAVQANQPILIGTQTIADAEVVYRMLSAKVPAGTQLHLLTGKNDYEAAQIFEHGGEVGSLIVATQLAGRGVDIRLSEQARANGGLALFCLGHSTTIRHDKQFIGRAGRQGDPYRARFVCSLQDELFLRFAGAKVSKFLELIGMEEGVAIESPMVTRRIVGAQNDARKAIFWSNQQQALMNATAFDIRQAAETWFEYLQLPATEEAVTDDPSPEFLSWVIDFYLKNVLDAIPRGRKSLTLTEAEQITAFLNDSLGLTKPPHAFSPLDIEARSSESATSIIGELLLKKLRDAMTESQRLRTSFYEDDWISLPTKVVDPSGNGGPPAPSIPTDSFSWHTIDRTPRQIAFWSVRSGWIGFLQERQRIIHRAYQKRLHYLEHYRLVTDQLSNQWQKTEREMATRVLRNLLRSAQPSTLGELFFYEDNRAEIDRERETPFTWESGPVSTDTFDPKETARLLIAQFGARAGTELNDSFTISHLRRLLTDFVEENALYTLQSPSKIQKALEQWDASEYQRGVATARRKLHKRWLRAFLIFLRERKLIGALPTFKTRLQSTLSKFVKTLTETRTVLTYVGVIAFVALFSAVVFWGQIGQPKQLGPFGASLDKILFAGLLAQGNVAAPAFGILIIASLIFLFFFPQRASMPKDANPVLKGLILILQVGFAWWLTDWHHGQMTPASVLRSLGVFLCIFLLSMIAKRAVWFLDDRFGISLIAGWVAFSVLYAFLPAVAGGLFAMSPPIIFFVTVTVAYYFWQYLNTHEIELVSTLLRSSTNSMRAEEISGSLRVEADSGALPHGYAILCTWLLYSFLTSQLFAARVSVSSTVLLVSLIAVYVSITIAVVVYVLHRRLSFVMWQKDLNERHQMIKDARDSEELHAKLRRIRQSLMTREVGFQLLVMLSAIYLLYGSTLLNTSFPLSLVLVFATFLFAVSGKSFALQLYKLFYNRMPLSIEVLDLSKTEDEAETRTTWQKVKRAAKVIFAVLVAVYGFLEVISNIYEVWQKFLAG